MDTGVPVYKIPANADRSELPRYEHERQLYQQKVDAVRVATVQHDMTQGFVLTQYFYEQLIQFEKDPASLKRHHRRDGLQHGCGPAGAPRAAIPSSTRRPMGTCWSAASRASSPAWIWPRPGWQTGDVATRERHGAAERWPYKSDTPGIGGDGGAGQFHPGAGGHHDRPSRGGDRRLPEDAGDQQGASACWPGRTSTWDGCWTWIASATKPVGVQGGTGGARRAAGYAAGRGARRQGGLCGEWPRCDEDAEDDTSGAGTAKPGATAPATGTAGSPSTAKPQ